MPTKKRRRSGEGTPPLGSRRKSESDQFIIKVNLNRPFAVTGVFAKFLADDIHVPRCLDTDPYGIRPNSNDRHRHIIADQNLLTGLSRKYQHAVPLSWFDKSFPVFPARGRHQLLLTFAVDGWC
jgi:hypothetical protein